MANNYCGICGRPLDNPLSVRLGIGPICLSRKKREATQDDQSQNQRLIEPVFNGTNDIVWKEWANGLATNVVQIVVWHSPTGYGVGYAGSGVADFALNICEMFLPHRPLTLTEQKQGVGNNLPTAIDLDFLREPVHCWRENYASRFAVHVHQKFKREFLERAPRSEGRLDGARVAAWLRAEMAAQLVKDQETYSGLSLSARKQLLEIESAA